MTVKARAASTWAACGNASNALRAALIQEIGLVFLTISTMLS